MEFSSTPPETPGETLHQSFEAESRSFLLRLLLLGGVLLVLLGILFYILPAKVSKLAPALAKAENSEQSASQVQAFFPPVQIEAKAAYVFDVTSGKVLYAKNENAQLPLASLTKLMTVAVAADLFKGNDIVTVSKEALADEGGGLTANEEWLPRDLITFTLIQSSNGGARAIASAAGALPNPGGSEYKTAEEHFIALMNDKGAQLGLRQTFFLNETGLDETSMGGGNGSAHDIATLMTYLLKNQPELLEGTRYEARSVSSLDNTKHVAINTNQDIGQIPGLIASKTGFTDLAGGNLVIAYDRGISRPIVIAVLGSSKEGRFADAKTLVDATFQYLQNQTL